MASRQIAFDHDWHALERLRSLTGFEFERHVAELYRRLGYQVELTRGGGDQGVDVIAQSPTERLGIQCKQWSSVVGNEGVQQAIAGRTFYNCSRAAVVCTSTFTAPARELASRASVQLIDGSTYAAMVNRFRPLTERVGLASWAPRGRAAVVQASMFAAALLIVVLHFVFQNDASRLQRAVAVLAQPGATARDYYAPPTTAPSAMPSQPFAVIVARYYTDVNSHQYADAYALLSPNFQNSQPYTKWVGGYSDTLLATPRIMPGRDPAFVSLVVTARERAADGTGTQVTVYNGAVRGIPTAGGSWLIDGGYLRMVSRVRE